MGASALGASFADDFSGGASDGRRRLLHLSPRGLAILGETLGWVMAFTYVISRIPQMWKTLASKDVKDMSFQMFCFTFSGNLTQMLSMVVKHPRELTGAYFS